MVRADEPDLIFKTEDAKFAAVAEDISQRFEVGQPVLVGTASVEKSEHLSRLLEKQGIPHTVLQREVPRARGEHRPRRPAVCTASPWRRTWPAAASTSCSAAIPEDRPRRTVSPRASIPPTPSKRRIFAAEVARFEAVCATEAEEVRRLGGLYVLGSERHESRRIDNQLRGRSGRQGDQGESRFYLSLEDELMRSSPPAR